MDPAVQFLIAVIVVPGVFAFGTWGVFELRSLRGALDTHQRDDRETFQTKETAGSQFNSISNRLSKIEADVGAIRQAVAPLPHQGGD